jgi:hypothetical protein
LSLTGNSFSNGASSYSLSADLPLQYFVADGLSLGGDVHWATFSLAAASSLQWFLNPSVSVGPGVLFAHEFGTGLIPDNDLYRFFVEVRVYL